MGRRRRAAILAASFLAHLALFGAWMATRAPERFVEPPAIQVALVAPPRLHPAPSPPASRRAPLSTRSSAPPIVPSPPAAGPLPSAPAGPVAPRVLSQEELLAGRDTDAEHLRLAVNRHRHVSAWDGCNKLPGPPDWTAPPCPPSGSNEEARHVLSLRTQAHEGEIARKDALQAYKDGTGAYPGLNCVLRGKHC